MPDDWAGKMRRGAKISRQEACFNIHLRELATEHNTNTQPKTKRNAHKKTLPGGAGPRLAVQDRPQEACFDIHFKSGDGRGGGEM